MQREQQAPDRIPTTAHQLAVERVIAAMHEHLHEPLSLHTMAAIAQLSPFHFSRVFRQVTGIPPGEFLAALRLDAAKQLLVTTNRDVTEICFEVGYSSLGSFTTRFTQLVGLSPRRMRRLADAFVPPAQALERNGPTRSVDIIQPDSACLYGTIHAPASPVRLIFVGLFSRPIPQAAPIGCALLVEPGPFQIDPVPDGRYYLLVAAVPWSSNSLNYMLPSADIMVGSSGGPLVKHQGAWNRSIDITLRPSRPTDPPILLFIPHLLAELHNTATFSASKR